MENCIDYYFDLDKEKRPLGNMLIESSVHFSN